MTTTTDRYTVGQLRFLLRHYLTLGESKPPTDPRMHREGRRQFGQAWWEDAVIRRADLANALRWLHERSWKANYAVRAYYIVGLKQREIAQYLEVDQSTVSRFCQDGVKLMAAFLNRELPKRA